MVLADSITWTGSDSAQLYGLERWGDPYFSINPRGHVSVQPRGDRGGSLDLMELVAGLQDRSLGLPLLIRFDDILEDRLERLHGAFERAMEHYGYSGKYQGVFPVKCNQQRHVVEEIVKYGREFGFGLEAGDRVGILSLNSDRYYESVFAIPWAGYCLVPLNTRWALPENAYAITDSVTRVLLFDDAFTEQAEELLGSGAGLEAAVYMGEGECPPWAQCYETLLSASAPIPASARGGDDMMGIFYTGGTTGFPKGVMQSHRAIWASAMGGLPAFEMTRDTVYLHAGDRRSQSRSVAQRQY